MFLTGYWLQVLLSWAVVAFATATVVVAVQKAQLEKDLRDVQSKIDIFEEWNGANGQRVKREDSVRNWSQMVNRKILITIICLWYVD